MPIPDQVVVGDSGHIQDHNDISGVLTDHESRIDSLEIDFSSLPSSSSIATTAYVTSAVSSGLASLVDSSPAALDTLNELAAALGDDANFATTINNSLATKQPIDGDLTAIASITGTSGLLKKTATETWTLDNTTYASQSYVNSQISGQLTNYLPLSGGILTGSLTGTTATFSGNVSTSSPTQNNHAATKLYVDTIAAGLTQPQQATFDRITDGTTIAIADSATDTFKLRGSNGITIVVSSDDGAHGDNALFSLSNVPNSALQNNSLSVNAGNGLTGGGSVSLGSTTTLSLSNSFSITGNISAANPTQSSHLTTKSYVDSFFSSSIFANAIIRATWTGSPIPSASDAAGVGIITVTFPVGRFTQPPSVVAQNIDDGSSSRMVYAKFTPYFITSSSVSMQITNHAPSSTITGGGTITKAIVDIHATQMTSGSAYG